MLLILILSIITSLSLSSVYNLSKTYNITFPILDLLLLLND